MLRVEQVSTIGATWRVLRKVLKLRICVNIYTHMCVEASRKYRIMDPGTGIKKEKRTPGSLSAETFCSWNRHWISIYIALA